MNGTVPPSSSSSIVAVSPFFGTFTVFATWSRISGDKDFSSGIGKGQFHGNPCDTQRRTMSELQLHLAIGLPGVTNGAMFLLFQSNIHKLLDAFRSEIDVRLDG